MIGHMVSHMIGHMISHMISHMSIHMSNVSTIVSTTTPCAHFAVEMNPVSSPSFCPSCSSVRASPVDCRPITTHCIEGERGERSQDMAFIYTQHTTSTKALKEQRERNKSRVHMYFLFMLNMCSRERERGSRVPCHLPVPSWLAGWPQEPLQQCTGT